MSTPTPSAYTSSPIRQISRQAFGGSSPVRVGRTGLFRQVKAKRRGVGYRKMVPANRATGSSRRRPASPGRSDSRDQDSRGRPQRRRRDSRRRLSPTRTRRKVRTKRAGCARLDGRLCGVRKTSVCIIASLSGDAKLPCSFAVLFAGRDGLWRCRLI